MPRPKGSPNKATAGREAYYASQGMMPLNYLLARMRDPEEDKAVRIDCAKAAAPYVHPKLAVIEAKHTGKVDIDVHKIERVIIEPGAQPALVKAQYVLIEGEAVEAIEAI